MKALGFLLVLVLALLNLTKAATTPKIKPDPTPVTVSNSSDINSSSSELSARVKRGYRSGYSTGIAYNRINDSGQLRSVADRNRHGKKQPDPIGEDGSHTHDFKSYGVGYEHHHGEHCEESKCGYNIRHCPHGCVFNSFLCGDSGSSYDTCCC